MSKVITEERFDDIKKFLNTPVLTKPSLSYAADEFGYSRGTISLINRFDSFEEYKDWRKNSYKEYLANQMALIAEERKLVRAEIDKFNNEWYFQTKYMDERDGTRK